MKTAAKQQYEWVKGSRQVLFDYCRTVSEKDFVDQNTSFGRGGSMRNLLVHIANTYQFWIANSGLQKNITYPKYEDCNTITDVIRLFESVDGFMAEFIETLDDEAEIPFEINGEKSSSSRLKLFTHVITHEYHHKGQVLSISRHLGYVPVDTDIMR